MELDQSIKRFHRYHIKHFLLNFLYLIGDLGLFYIEVSKYQFTAIKRLVSRNRRLLHNICSLLKSSSKVYKTDRNHPMSNRRCISRKTNSYLEILQSCHSTRRCSLECYSCGFCTYCSAHRLKLSLNQKYSRNICQQCIFSFRQIFNSSRSIPRLLSHRIHRFL